jgi:tetratricopeptide (TPR) repeat protein
MANYEATTDLRLALNHAARLMQENPALAAKQARKILGVHPDEPNALNLLGAAQRLSRHPESSRKTLERLVAMQPDMAMAHFELGLTLQALGATVQAQAALERATELAPEVPAAWKALGDVRAANGDDEGSQDAYQNHLVRVAGHPELVQATRLVLAGKFGKAEPICREFLKRHPSNVSAIRLLADIGIRLGRLADAEALLRRCLELAPGFHMARSNYANLLFKKLRYQPALEEIEKVIRAEPDNPSHWILKASILGRIGELESAIEIYEKVLADYPNQARCRLSQGHALKTVGRQEQAVVAYRKAIELRPSLGEAYWSLANLKTFQFDDDEIETMRRRVLSKGGKTEDYYHLYFSLGKALEDRGLYEEAFEAYRRGNLVRRETVRWDADAHHANMQELIGFFDSALFAEREGQGCPSPAPILIVGLPRAGSTLLEQILASHSQVEGTMELPDIISIARRLSGKKKREEQSLYPRILGDMSPDQLRELGEEYLERTRVHRRGAPFFIDKMPNNFSHIGLIHLILPQARIIDARRQPLACCFSGFKQLFASGQNFTYSLEEIGRYYRDYVELMAHWDKVLPGRVLRMNYEAVVADIETQVRRLLDYCGLPFEASCVEFHKTQRAVRTASSEQVRQPIYDAAVEQWRNFEPWLGPLITALGPELAVQERLGESDT